jgi:hypothetical protein
MEKLKESVPNPIQSLLSEVLAKILPPGLVTPPSYEKQV